MLHSRWIERRRRRVSVSGDPGIGAPVRRYPGARRLALSTGEQVRYIDVSTFEIIVTGELLSRIN